MIKGLQLVFDCDDPDVIAQFWGRMLEYNNDLLDLSIEQVREWRKDYPQFDGRARIDDADERRMPVYIQKVPEPKVGRNRLRPVVAVQIEAARQLGATPTGRLNEFYDPEGNEFTLVEGDFAAMRSIVIDCLDPHRMLDFWVEATGYARGEGRCDPQPQEDAGLLPGLAFVATSEPKRIKDRLHIDLHTTDAEAHRERLIALGATVQRWDEEHVMLDPEGNEFCVG